MIQWNIIVLLLMYGTNVQHAANDDIAESATDVWPSYVGGGEKKSLDFNCQFPVKQRRTFPHPVLTEFAVQSRRFISTKSRDLISKPTHLRVDAPEDELRELETPQDGGTKVEEEEEKLNMEQLLLFSASIKFIPLEVNGSRKDNHFQRTQTTREIAENYNSVNVKISIANLLESIMEVVSSNHNVIILHDNHPETQADINYLSKLKLDIPMIIIDINDNEIPESSWIGDYNAAIDVHILIFRDIEVVSDFIDALPERLWTPNHLLLFNGHPSANAAALIGHPKFTYSTFLTLLQLDQRHRSRPIFQILTYEGFRKGNKVIRKGFLGHHQAALPSFDLLFPDRFEYFHGYHFHLSSWVDDFPYMVEGDTLEDTYGMCIYMLDDIAQRLNFTYQVYPYPEDQLWGDFYNGSWRGMIGEVWSGKRDFCVNVMSYIEERFKAVDFSVPYFIDSDSVVIRNPLPPPRWWAIAFPFSWGTWIAVGMTLLTMPVCLLLLMKIKRVPVPDVSYIFLEITRTVLRQDASALTPYTSIRIFVGVWWLVAMILSISYTGNLIAFITVPAKAQPMKTLYELAHSDLMLTMVDYGNYMPSVMKSSGDPTLMTLGEKIEYVPNQEYQLGFDLVNEGTHAFLEGTEYFRYMVILFKASNTYFLKEEFFPSYVGWIYPKKTAWKHKFDKYIQRFVEAGLWVFWRNTLVFDFKREMNLTWVVRQETVVKPLSLADLQGAFAVYGFFLAIALVLGVMEITICTKVDEDSKDNAELDKSEA